MQNNGNNYKWPQEVHVFGCIASRAPGNIEEMVELEAGPAALTIGMDVLGDDTVQQRRRLGIVVIGRHFQVGIVAMALKEAQWRV